VKSPFDPQDCQIVTITLPPKGQTVGIYVETDEDYLLPVLAKVSKEYKAYDEIPLKHHFYKSWIIQIGNEFPITGQGFVDAVHSYQMDTP
jgi:hypothetical protein